MLQAEGVPECATVVTKATDARQRLQHLTEGVQDGFIQQAAAAPARQPSGRGAAPVPPARQRSAAARLEAEQLAVLAEMGFDDAEAARSALAAAQYDVQRAAELLMEE